MAISFSMAVPAGCKCCGGLCCDFCGEDVLCLSFAGWTGEPQPPGSACPMALYEILNVITLPLTRTQSCPPFGQTEWRVIKFVYYQYCGELFEYVGTEFDAKLVASASTDGDFCDVYLEVIIRGEGGILDIYKIETPLLSFVRAEDGCMTLSETAGDLTIDYLPVSTPPPIPDASEATFTLTAGPCVGYGYEEEEDPAPLMMARAAPAQARAIPAMTSRFAVVTMAIGQAGRDLLAISGPSIGAAAKRWGADYHVITGEDADWAIGEKFRLDEYVRRYERTFYLDADAWVPPTTPSPFETFPPGYAYLFNELPYHAAQGRPMGWVEDESRQLAESQGWEPPGPLETYYNAGVMLLDRDHAAAVGPPDRDYPVWHCSEQNFTNIRLRRFGIPVVDWGVAWNMQWWINHDMKPPDGSTPNVLHFSGMNPMGRSGNSRQRHQARLALMRKHAGLARRVECEMLGERTEFRAGCGGWNCLHACTSDRGDVRDHLGDVMTTAPGGDCQDCPGYVPRAK